MAAIIRRVTLVADTLTALNKPGGSDFLQVAVGNGGTATLYVYAGDTPEEDTDNFLKIAPGVERLVRFRSNRSTDVVAYLKSSTGGEVVLVWG